MKTKQLINVLLILIITFTLLHFNTVQAVDTNENDLNLYSHAAILLENKTGKILYEKNSDKKMYPASTTKILTAILAIENGNLNKKVKVSKKALAQMKSGYSSAYLVEGEELTIEDLITVLLVHSANDAANVIAESVSGSMENFVTLMNQKLKEIGCTHTHFVTTNGLHDDNHYTTAKDLAKIMRYCMQNATFRKISGMPKCIIPKTNKIATRVYNNTNDMIIQSSKYYYPGCIAGKTGYTSQARNCLVSACSKDNLQLIAVVLGASLTKDNQSARYVDTKTLYDYGYSHFSIETIAKKASVIEAIQVKNATPETKSLNLVLDKDIKSVVNTADKDNIEREIKLNNDEIKAPIAAKSVIGQVSYKVSGETYTANLLASHDVEPKKYDYTFFLIGGSIIIVIFILTLILIILIKKGKKNIEE